MPRATPIIGEEEREAIILKRRRAWDEALEENRRLPEEAARIHRELNEAERIMEDLQDQCETDRQGGRA